MAIAHRITWRLLLSATWIFSCLPALAFDLNGVWSTDASLCTKVFVKKGDSIAFQPDADQYGSGFIIEGSHIRGPTAKCEIKSRKEVAGIIHLIASCATDIMLSDTQFSLKVVDDNNIVRVYPEMPDLSLAYARCSF
jgi:hypothetical protein